MTAVWWLVESRFDLGDRANEALDHWAIPVIPGLLSALLVPLVVTVGFVLALVGHAYWMSLKDAKAQARAMGDTVEGDGFVSPPSSSPGSGMPVRMETEYPQIRDDREEYRRYVAQQIERGEAISEWRSSEFRRGVLHPNRSGERAWVAETYSGLRDRNEEDATYFGSFSDFGSLEDRINRLIHILEYM